MSLDAVASASEPIRGDVAGVTFAEALEHLGEAATALFDHDRTVRSVGIAAHGAGFGYRAVRNSSMITPFSAHSVPVTRFRNIPVRITGVPGEVRPLLKLPHTGPGSSQASTVVPETARQQPLTGGLQVQNFDDDDREGIIQQGFIIIGTLGCLVRLADGAVALLSNNHVVAGENRGIRQKDRILQPGSSAFSTTDHVAVLEDFVPLVTSPTGATLAQGNVNTNVVDAGVARLVKGVAYAKGYLPQRAVPAPNGVAPAMIGDRVFKVGRTTGLTYGTITDVSTVVGPVGYDLGECWFIRSIVVEGVDGTLFSDRGDSGSAVVKDNGELVGLLYAGNGEQTYVCPIDEVLRALNCSLL